ncbi:serine hydrolase domain-containing protein [Lysinibacillus sp. NPDC093712]|uniref:serine hydrolase domain-containing protein n=1 Tax=Lysinibacillus sp. NPDC093712 TaxID=3390579 RepID=UPI003D07FCB5
MSNINIEERMKHYRVQGLSLLFIENGQISKIEHHGTLKAGTHHQVDEHSVFNACSISKFLTSMLVMKLVEQGYLNLDEDVNEKLKAWKVPENPFTKHKKVTLRNLLCHQSGIIDPADSFSPLHALQAKPSSIVDLLNGKSPYCQSRIEVSNEPWHKFHYSDAGFCIIQQLIEDVMKQSFDAIMDELIFKSLNMANSTFSTSITKSQEKIFACGHHQNGELVTGNYPIYPYSAASGLWTSPTDLAKLLLEFMNAIKGSSKIGISAKLAKAFIQPQGGKAWTGLGLFLDGSEHEVEISSLGWGVGFQCMLVAYPYLEKGFIVMTNTDLGVHQMKGIIGDLYKSFMSCT